MSARRSPHNTGYGKTAEKEEAPPQIPEHAPTLSSLLQNLTVGPKTDMTSLKSITRNEILPYAEYAESRKERKRALTEKKKIVV